MKKSLITLLVLALVGPAMAATQVDATGGAGVITITVTVTDDDVVRGLAVLVEQADGDAGDMAIALDGGEFDVDAGAFNTFIDYAFSAGAGYTAVGDGHPIAMVGAAGEIAPVAGVQDFVVSAGYLDEDGDATLGEGLGAGVYEIIVNMEGSATTVFDVALDTLRGGIVGDNLEVTDNLLSVTVDPAGDPDCMSPSHPDYTRWVQFGKPDAWCYQWNCRGDADGKSQGNVFTGLRPVDTDDLNVLLAAWQQLEANIDGISVNGVPGIAADFNRASQGNIFSGFRPVDTDDLNILLTNWQQLEANVPVCDATNINFWITP